MARYLLPVEPLMVPVVMYVFGRLYEGRWRRSFAVWMACVVIAVAAALLVCLELQTGAISSWLHA